jgi:hypothetical protein
MMPCLNIEENVLLYVIHIFFKHMILNDCAIIYNCQLWPTMNKCIRKLYVNFVPSKYDFVTKDLASMFCRMLGDVLLTSCMYTIPHVEHACSNYTRPLQ